jgi:hypothetical protein
MVLPVTLHRRYINPLLTRWVILGLCDANA